MAVLNLTPEAHWLWWWVLLPVWAVLGHNILYITVRFVGLSFADHGAPEDESQSAEGHAGYRYQLAALVCVIVFADNVLRRIEGRGEMIWFAVSSGRWELILVSAILIVLLQLLFWPEVVAPGNRQAH